jgi:hypothetical protein
MNKGQIDFYIKVEKRNLAQLEKCLEKMKKYISYKKEEIKWLYDVKEKK